MLFHKAPAVLEFYSASNYAFNAAEKLPTVEFQIGIKKNATRIATAEVKTKAQGKAPIRLSPEYGF
jgi:hypothetical protein